LNPVLGNKMQRSNIFYLSRMKTTAKNIPENITKQFIQDAKIIISLIFSKINILQSKMG
jgi:hypothetical protein